MLIRAKSKGLDLFSHSEAVKDTALRFNEKGNFNLNIDIIKWMCIMHDIGKANPLFQINMDLDKPSKICRHEISSILFIDCVPNEIKDIVAFSILSHHKSIKDEEKSLYELYDKQTKTLYENHINNIEEWGLTVSKYFLCHYNTSIAIPSRERCIEILDEYFEKIRTIGYGYSLYRGLLMMADHFASCYENNEERLKKIDKLFEIPKVSCYCGKNDKYPLSLIDSDLSKRHTLCIAPTGVGKTNFMMKRTTRRVFYTLPYQASINAMFNRINHDIGSDCLVGLRHGSISAVSFIDEDIKLLSSFYGVPVKIITPFQILSVILRLKGYESLILDLQGQDIIFDELHTYDFKNQYFIMKMMEFLKNINCNIHVCTATMPKYMQEEIKEMLGAEDTQYVKLSDKVLDTFNRHIIHTIDSFDFDDIKRRYESGEKILIVKNQVDKAIDIFNELKERIHGCKIMLIHSRFKRCDRVLKEQQLMNDFNKSIEPCIVVSTQVVEVSIDINFDVLYTDNADIMSLIQRFGRINRQRNNIGILKDVFVVRHTKDSTKPYEDDICNSTFNELSKYNNQVLEEKKIQEIIDNVHSEKVNEVYERANPYSDDGSWKQKMYSHVVNSSIPKEFEFEGYIGILESDSKEYEETNNKDFEIPIPNLKEHFKLIKGKYFEIPNENYSFELGLNFI